MTQINRKGIKEPDSKNLNMYTKAEAKDRRILSTEVFFKKYVKQNRKAQSSWKDKQAEKNVCKIVSE